MAASCVGPRGLAPSDVEVLSMLEVMLAGVHEAQPSMPLCFMRHNLAKRQGVRVTDAAARVVYNSMGMLGVEIALTTAEGVFTASTTLAAHDCTKLKRMYVERDGEESPAAPASPPPQPPLPTTGQTLTSLPPAADRTPSRQSLQHAVRSPTKSPEVTPTTFHPSTVKRPVVKPPWHVYDVQAHAEDLLTTRLRVVLKEIVGCDAGNFKAALNAAMEVAAGAVGGSGPCSPLTLPVGAAPSAGDGDGTPGDANVPIDDPASPSLGDTTGSIQGLPPGVHSGMYGSTGLTLSGLDPTVLFAMSFAALRAANASLPVPTPLWETLTPSPKPYTLPCPIVTVFEGSSLNHSELPIQEVAVALYTSSFAKALSYAREITERLRPAPGTYSIGVRGGFVPRRAPSLYALLDQLQQAIKVIIDPCDRAKIFVHFGSKDGGFCNTHIAGKRSFSVMDNMKEGAQAGALDAVIDPFSAELVDGWGVANMLGLTTCVDNVLEIGAGFSPSSADIPVDVAFLHAKGCKTVQRLMDIGQGIDMHRQRGANARGDVTDGLLVSLRADAYETGDPWLAECAMALRCDFVMFGGLYSGERTALYNELLRVEDYLRERHVTTYTPVPGRWI